MHNSSLGTIFTTTKDPMVASTTTRPSADSRTEQPLDLLQAPGFKNFLELCGSLRQAEMGGQENEAYPKQIGQQ